MKATCSVVVIYEDAHARERAVGYCDVLVRRFWERRDFEVSWLSFQQVEDALSLTKACGADLLVFGTRHEIPAGIQRWLERWLIERANREGALVNVSDTASPPYNPVAAKVDNYLRNVAHRGNLDYLTQVPSEIFGAIPESTESCSHRAQQVTSVLDEILHRRAGPPQM